MKESYFELFERLTLSYRLQSNLVRIDGKGEGSTREIIKIKRRKRRGNKKKIVRV